MLGAVHRGEHTLQQAETLLEREEAAEAGRRQMLTGDGEVQRRMLARKAFPRGDESGRPNFA